MNNKKCLYCGNIPDNSDAYEIKNRGFCCSSECQSKAENAFNKPFDFQLSRYFLIFLGLCVILFFANDLTLKLDYFNHIVGIIWGAFIALLPFVSKPVFPFSIKKSHIFTAALGLFIIIMSALSLM